MLNYENFNEAMKKKNNITDLPKYDIFHFEKHIHSNIKVNVLYLLKETTDYYISIESWGAYCKSLKKSKKNFAPKFDINNIPIISNETTIEYLDFVFEVFNNEKKLDFEAETNLDSDDNEAKTFLRKLFPHKQIVMIRDLKYYGSEYYQNGGYELEDNRKKRHYFDELSDNEFCDMLTDIGEKIIICPYIFSKPKFSYFDGEIYFIQTSNAIYFDVRR